MHHSDATYFKPKDWILYRGVDTKLMPIDSTTPYYGIRICFEGFNF